MKIRGFNIFLNRIYLFLFFLMVFGQIICTFMILHPLAFSASILYFEKLFLNLNLDFFNLHKV